MSAGSIPEPQPETEIGVRSVPSAIQIAGDPLDRVRDHPTEERCPRRDLARGLGVDRSVALELARRGSPGHGGDRHSGDHCRTDVPEAFAEALRGLPVTEIRLAEDVGAKLADSSRIAA